MKTLRMILALIIALAVTVPLTACGVKDNLERPNDQPMKKGEKDASKPPSPLGR